MPSSAPSGCQRKSREPYHGFMICVVLGLSLAVVGLLLFLKDETAHNVIWIPIEVFPGRPLIEQWGSYDNLDIAVTIAAVKHGAKGST